MPRRGLAVCHTGITETLVSVRPECGAMIIVSHPGPVVGSARPSFLRCSQSDYLVPCQDSALWTIAAKVTTVATSSAEKHPGSPDLVGEKEDSTH